MDPSQTRLDREKLCVYLLEAEERLRFNKIGGMYPDVGQFARYKYPKHLEFFAAGRRFRQRAFMAANRVGKTEGGGGYEAVLHLTGQYPLWWNGKKFNKPVRGWVVGDTLKTAREILQYKLLGDIDNIGTGLIPKSRIISVARMAGVTGAIESVTVRHGLGGESRLVFKSYDQKREAFQGSEQDFILLDEEPPMDVYTECLMRTMTNNGIIMLTFTPLRGMSDVVRQFMEPEVGDKSKKLVQATWDDVPHLTAEAKNELWAGIPPYQRDARSKGIPALGSGAIYPVSESDILVDSFDIPAHWPRCYGLDVGWNRTACIWGALDRENDILYLYSEYYKGQAEPVIHAEAIKSRGKWIRGVIDPASNGRSQVDGNQVMELYKRAGLELSPADNAVEAGIYEVWSRLSTGRLKVFNTLQSWLSEYRLYQRDEKGKVVKKDDHLMDAMRYLVFSGLDVADTEPVKRKSGIFSVGNWMG